MQDNRCSWEPEGTSGSLLLKINKNMELLEMQVWDADQGLHDSGRNDARGQIESCSMPM